MKREDLKKNVNCCRTDGKPCYMSRWDDEFRCAFCETVLTHEERRTCKFCPYCEEDLSYTRSIKTITQHPYRYVRYGYWWQFWKKFERQYEY